MYLSSIVSGREGPREDPPADVSTSETGPARSLSNIYRCDKSCGDRTNFLDCKCSVTVVVRAINSKVYDELHSVEDNVTQDNSQSRLNNEQKDISQQLYAPLASLAKAETAANVRSGEDSNGLQAWPALFTFNIFDNESDVSRHVNREWMCDNRRDKCERRSSQSWRHMT